MAKKCGKPYRVKIGNHWYTKYCGKKAGHWFGCGPK